MELQYGLINATKITQAEKELFVIVEKRNFQFCKISFPSALSQT